LLIAAPLPEPAVNAMLALPSPGVAARLVGSAGAAAGVTALDSLDALLVPAAFVAVTVNV